MILPAIATILDKGRKGRSEGFTEPTNSALKVNYRPSIHRLPASPLSAAVRNITHETAAASFLVSYKRRIFTWTTLVCKARFL